MAYIPGGASLAPLAKKKPKPSPKPAPLPGYPVRTGLDAPTIWGGGKKAVSPNFGALIDVDPGLLSYRGSEATALAGGSADRAAAVRALAVRYGGVPQGMADRYGDIDQSTRDLAGQNQFSDIANLQRGRSAAQTSLVDDLAARGMLRSGGLAGGLNGLNLDYGQREYDAGNAFANAYNQAIQNYTSLVNQQKQGEADAISKAAEAVYANPMNRTFGPPATLVPGAPTGQSSTFLGSAPSDHPTTTGLGLTPGSSALTSLASDHPLIPRRPRPVRMAGQMARNAL